MSLTLTPANRQRLLELGVATVYEASGVACALDHAIRPAWPGASVCGTAYTVRCQPGDNLAIHRALEHVSPGDVLVVHAGGFIGGNWGEVLTLAAQARGVVGLVIDGGVRDVDQLQRLRFGVFCRGIGVFGTTKNVAGELGESLVLGGVLVRTGDLVLGDSDGVLALSVDRVPATLEAAEKRAEKEIDYFRRIKDGELTLDIMGLRRDSH